MQHGLIAIGQLFAVSSALRTSFGALATNMWMMRRLPKHKVLAGCANLGAIQQQGDVRDARVFSTHFETVYGGTQADLMTLATVLNTGLHCG